MTTRTPERAAPGGTGTRWRRATGQDAVALRDLERAANLVGLAHVFDSAVHPFPDDAVLARWQETLRDPHVRVDVVDSSTTGSLLACSAHDATTLRHLAVHPQAWGRGLGAQGVALALGAIGPGARLWVLELNTRARALYERLGWSHTGTTQVCPWPPHPLELQYTFGALEFGADG